MMSCHLSKELQTKYSCRSVPVRKGDTVLIKTGDTEKGIRGKTGKVLTVYRRRWCIHVEKVVKDKKNGSQVQVPIDPSNCEITQLKLDKSRKALLQRKNRSSASGAGDMDWAQLLDWDSSSVNMKTSYKQPFACFELQFGITKCHLLDSVFFISVLFSLSLFNIITF